MMGPYLLGCKWKGGTAREKELLAPSPRLVGVFSPEGSIWLS
jgi:hypothetical protein